MFEWDEGKRLVNLAKHRLDFADARLMFDGRPTLTAASAYPFEARFLTVAMINGKIFTVVWTWRGEARRIISFRRSRNGEERTYRQAHG